MEPCDRGLKPALAGERRCIVHRAHDERPNRNSGVRRHRQPHERLTGCDQRQFPYTTVLKAQARKAQRRADATEIIDRLGDFNIFVL
jgi:hypothetical protein